MGHTIRLDSRGREDLKLPHKFLYKNNKKDIINLFIFRTPTNV